MLRRVRFSALLRAEKSEMALMSGTAPAVLTVSVLFCEPKNRKSGVPPAPPPAFHRFSALLRAEKSEIVLPGGARRWRLSVSVLFCEPKNRKYSARCAYFEVRTVSVLFCEPKNRKCLRQTRSRSTRRGFSALLRAEKSEIPLPKIRHPCFVEFQCSSASRKIGNQQNCGIGHTIPRVSVLFCEPKNRKYFRPRAFFASRERFSALLRAEKSEIDIEIFYAEFDLVVSVLFCEPKNRK